MTKPTALLKKNSLADFSVIFSKFRKTSSGINYFCILLNYDIKEKTAYKQLSVTENGKIFSDG